MNQVAGKAGDLSLIAGLQPTDWLALLVSLAAVTISFIALWRTHLSPFRPTFTAGKLRRCIYTIESDGERWHIVSFDVPLSVANLGVRVGHLNGLRLKLSFPDLPIPGNFEILPVQWEIPPREARLISSDRFTWLQELSVTDWLPVTVLGRSATTRHFIFETRWDEPVVQGRVLARIEALSDRRDKWDTIAQYEFSLYPDEWAEMVHAGSSFVSSPFGSSHTSEGTHPPDLHRYTGAKARIPDEGSPRHLD